jgi:hypothetical protein
MNLKDRIQNFNSAYKEGGLSLAVKTLSGASLEASTYRGLNSIFDNGPVYNYQDGAGDFWTMVMGTGGAFSHFGYKNYESAWNAFWMCPPLHSIIMRKTRSYSNGMPYLLDDKGKEVTQGNRINYYSGIFDLLKRPNAIQNWRHFDAQLYTSLQIWQFAVVLTNVPVGYNGLTNASSMFVLPVQYLEFNQKPQIDITSLTDLRDAFDSIRLNYGGYTITLPLENLLIFRDFNLSCGDYSILPDSLVRANEKPINNIIGAYDSRGKLINYRGALGILSKDARGGELAGLNISKTEKETVQREFKRYGLRSDQFNMIITNAALKWQQIGIPTKDLMLFEEIEADIQQLCNEWGYQNRLLGSNSANSLGGADANAYNAMVYQNAIIPEANNIYEQWTQFSKLDEKGYKIEKDFSKEPCLQEDDGKKATARKSRNDAYQIEWENNLCTLNEWRAANGDDPVKKDGDLYKFEWDQKNKPQQNEQQNQNPAGTGNPVA